MQILEIDAIKSIYPCAQPFDFTKHTTIGCGGVASLGIYPKSQNEALAVWKALRASKIPFTVVGNGSNILPFDVLVSRVVICMKELKEIAFTPNGVYVGAGVLPSALLRFCKEQALEGAEFLTGIPCTLGGAVYMNAGVGGTYISGIIHSVRVIHGDEISELPLEECNYAYKSSVFMEGENLILGATLRLRPSEVGFIEKRIFEYASKRARLPKGKSMGCIFKNPDGQFAGRLIEGAGLKGLRCGGAVVSDKHANFIINDKHATSKDIQSLIQIVKNAVFSQYRVRLEEEIRYVQ